MPKFVITKKTIAYSQIVVEADTSALAETASEQDFLLWGDADEYGHKDTFTSEPLDDSYDFPAEDQVY